MLGDLKKKLKQSDIRNNTIQLDSYNQQVFTNILSGYIKNLFVNSRKKFAYKKLIKKYHVRNLKSLCNLLVNSVNVRVLPIQNVYKNTFQQVYNYLEEHKKEDNIQQYIHSDFNNVNNHKNIINEINHILQSQDYEDNFFNIMNRDNDNCIFKQIIEFYGYNYIVIVHVNNDFPKDLLYASQQLSQKNTLSQYRDTSVDELGLNITFDDTNMYVQQLINEKHTPDKYTIFISNSVSNIANNKQSKQDCDNIIQNQLEHVFDQIRYNLDKDLNIILNLANYNDYTGLAS